MFKSELIKREEEDPMGPSLLVQPQTERRAQSFCHFVKNEYGIDAVHCFQTTYWKIKYQQDNHTDITYRLVCSYPAELPAGFLSFTGKLWLVHFYKMCVCKFKTEELAHIYSFNLFK